MSCFPCFKSNNYRDTADLDVEEKRVFDSLAIPLPQEQINNFQLPQQDTDSEGTGASDERLFTLGTKAPIDNNRSFENLDVTTISAGISVLSPTSKAVRANEIKEKFKMYEEEEKNEQVTLQKATPMLEQAIVEKRTIPNNKEASENTHNKKKKKRKKRKRKKGDTKEEVKDINRVIELPPVPVSAEADLRNTPRQGYGNGANRLFA